MKRRSKFNLSFYNMLSCKMGYLVPVGLTELLPGDSIQLSHNMLMRLAPMVAPVMHPVHVTIQTFFTPLRIIFDDFESAITGGPDGADATVFPTVSIKPEQSSLADYLGLPLAPQALTVSALPFRAYDLIYNEYYRDQDLTPELPISKAAGVDTTTSTTLQRVSWSKDYFTTARPWPQKGPDVSIPVEGQQGTFSISSTGTPIIDIKLTDSGGPNTVTKQVPLMSRATKPSTSSGHYGALEFYVEADNPPWTNTIPVDGPVTISNPNLKIDGDINLGTIPISLLREAFAIQRFQEQRGLFGSRYEDYLRTLGVRPQDSRLQMPEYLGGSTRTIQFSEVLQTGGDTIGQLYGHGIAALGSRRIRYFAPEHGYLMSLMFVRPIPVYAQGIDKLWSRKTKEDFWQPQFEHIGQQKVLTKEIYATGSPDFDNATWGWQNRYDEYRRGVNHVSGEFRDTQDYWHMARMFDSNPVLNADFVQCHPTDRIFQASEANADQLLCMVQNRLIARRLVSKNGNPI